MYPILLEVVAPMLSSVEIYSWGHSFITGYLGLRSKYRNSCLNEYPDDWKWAVDYLSLWIQKVSYLYRHRIRIRVIDAQSPLGLWKQLRYRIFRFPAFIVDQKKTYKIVTNSYLAAGGDGYGMFMKALNSYDSSMFQRDVLIEYIQHLGGIINPDTKERFKIR